MKINFFVTTAGELEDTKIDDIVTWYPGYIIYGAINPNISSAVTVYNVNESVSFVPALFTVEGEQTYVAIKRGGDNVYAIVQEFKTFSDIQTHKDRNHRVVGLQEDHSGYLENDFLT